MDEKKNIDRLFQEKFKDYEVFPDPVVWNNIEEQITKKKRRRIVPLWLRLGSAAAVLLLLVSTGFWYFDQDQITSPDVVPNEIIITDTNQEDEKKNENSTSTNDTNSIVNTKSNLSKKEQNLIANPTKKKHQINSDNTEIVQKIAVEDKVTKDFLEEVKDNAVVVENIPTKNAEEELNINNDIKKVETISNSEKAAIALEEATNESDNKLDIQKEIEKSNIENAETEIANIKPKKWSIGSTISPIYFDNIGNGSPIDPALANNVKDGDNSVSYGLKVSYKLSDKLSLQSGINSLELGYTTENVRTLLSSSLLDGSTTNISTNVEGVSVAAVSTVSQNSEAFSQRSSIDLQGSMDQTFSYIEIPMEAKYNILQKKIGVNLIGGFSTYLLHQNTISISSFGKKTTIGEASNINKINFSGNLGVDFDYNLSKKLFINVSPMFKYQFNTFSENSGGFQPYYFGVYTGLNFRF